MAKTLIVKLVEEQPHRRVIFENEMAAVPRVGDLIRTGALSYHRVTIVTWNCLSQLRGNNDIVEVGVTRIEF